MLIFLTLLFIAVSIALILVIPVQRPQGGGLAGAFGGAGGGGTDTAFGGRTGDVLTIGTVAAFSVYLLLAVVLNIMDNETLEAAAGTETVTTETTTDAGDSSETSTTNPAPAATTPDSATNVPPGSSAPAPSGSSDANPGG